MDSDKGTDKAIKPAYFGGIQAAVLYVYMISL